MTIGVLASIGLTLAAYKLYLISFSNEYPPEARDHLRRALVGQQSHQPFENVEFEFKQAIQACLASNLAYTLCILIAIQMDLMMIQMKSWVSMKD